MTATGPSLTSEGGGLLVGREREVGAIDALLDRAVSGLSSALVLKGEPGIGKSALLEHALGRAEGLRVLRAAGVEAEAELPFSALHQLLHPLVPQLPTLVDVHRRALEGALGLSADRVEDPFLIGAATLSLLAEAADAQPLLCVVDDAHWVDAASREALLFAIRRLGAEGVAVLLAERAAGPAAREELPELWVDRLSAGAARSLLRARYGSTLAPSALERLVEAGAGNPLALVVLAAALSEAQRLGRESLPQPLGLAGGIEDAYREQVHELPAATQALLLLAAAEGTGETSVLFDAAAALGIEAAALDPAETAGLIRFAGAQIAFRHPLVRAAVYGGATFAERRRAHRALANVLSRPEDADRRAWHLAEGTIGFDEEVADLLEQTADRARARGGFAASSSAMERAARLTAQNGVRARRLVQAADSAFRAGESSRALLLLDEVGTHAEDHVVRATALQVRGVIELRAGTPLAAVPLFLAAARDTAPLEPSLALRLAMRAAEAAALGGAPGRVPVILDWVETLGDFERGEDRLIRFLLEGLAAVYRGEPREGVPAFASAVAEIGELHDPLVIHWAATAANYLGQEERAEALYRAAVDRARTTGEVYALPFSLLRLATVEFGRGAHAGAEADASEGLRLARETGQESVVAHCLALLAQTAAARGAEEECAALAAEALELAVPRRLLLASTSATFALAELDLALGRSLRALERLEALLESGDVHPLYRLFGAPTVVEAGARAGWPDRVRTWLPPFEEWARAADVVLGLPLVARCHAQLADGEEAEAHYREALRLHARRPEPYERARTELAYGEFLRRAKRKSDARTHLRSALEAFEALGAAPWADRARAELRATGETARRRSDETRAELTPQELQVARLVARGATNREAAAQLFLSPKTVEYHLHKVFTKLAVSSRTELAGLDLWRDEVVAL